MSRRKDGRWHVGWYETEVNGDRKHYSTTAATEEQARAKLDQVLFRRNGSWGYGHLKHLSDDGAVKVYFAQTVSGGPIKIGLAKRLKTRMLALQSGCPYPLQVLHVIEPAGYSVETALHKRFFSIRSHGEWFHPKLELCDLIERMKALGNDSEAQKALIFEGRNVHELLSKNAKRAYLREIRP